MKILCNNCGYEFDSTSDKKCPRCNACIIKHRGCESCRGCSILGKCRTEKKGDMSE